MVGVEESGLKRKYYRLDSLRSSSLPCAPVSETYSVVFAIMTMRIAHLVVFSVFSCNSKVFLSVSNAM